MEPVVLICEGCGVRIRTTRPVDARMRACPRCERSLATSVDRALASKAVDLDLIADSAEPPAARPLRRRRTTAALALLLLIGSAAVVAVREGSMPSNRAGESTSRAVESPPRPREVARPVVEERPVARAEATPDQVPAEGIPDLAARPVAPPSKDLAIREADGRDADVILDASRPPRPHPGPGQISPPPPMPERHESSEPRRLRVRDKKGQAVVAREHGFFKGQVTVLLPDGQIGWLDDRVVTDEPFVPATMDEMHRAILDDPEFTTFRVRKTAHYLVVYQSSDAFARASGELLEKLHDGLTGALKKNGLPVVPVEFPLIAVVFATEDDFRANRPVAPDVQAYYETLTNRIYFYEKSRRDQDSPEVSALRKPQTVAHEGTHQILHNVGIQPRLSDWPLWLVEGLAEYCSSTRLTRKGVEWAGLGQVNLIHMATIRDIDDPLPTNFPGGPRGAVAPRDRGTPLVEYLVTRKELTPTDYALAWALTHYLATQRIDDFVAYIGRMSRMKPFEAQSPQEQLANFREVFGADLAQLDGRVAKYLKKNKQADALPYFAVIFEQQVGPTTRRHAMVSQSSSIIRQWRESIAAPEGGIPQWLAFRHPTRKKAVEAVEQWMMHGH